MTKFRLLNSVMVVFVHKNTPEKLDNNFSGVDYFCDSPFYKC